MKKSILITGASGAGKSALSEELKRLGYSAYDLDEIDGLYEMVDKITHKPITDHDNKDLKKVQKMDWICNVEKLKNLIEGEKNELTFYCGNASNWKEILPFFTKIILLQADEKNTRHRLTTRTTNDFGSTPEIQDHIMSYKEKWENEILEKGGIPIDTNRALNDVALDVIKISIAL